MAYPISSALKEAFLAEHRQVARLTVTPLSGSAITLTEANIVQGSLVIDRASTTGDTFELGGCIASELSFSVYNEEGTYNNFAWSGATIKAEIGVVDDDDAVIGYIPMGYFIIDSVPKVRSVINITALDRMVKFDKLVPLSSFMTWAVNKTVQQYVSRICSQCGVTLATSVTGFNNTEYVIPTPPSEDGMTYRQLLLWCCQMMGKQGYMDWNGQLRIDSTPAIADDDATSIVGDAVVGDAIVGYPKTSGLGTDIEDVSETERFNSDYEDYTVEITGVAYTDDDGTDWLSGTEDYVIDLTGNPLIQDPNYLLPYIGASIIGVPYTPFSATTIPYPYLFPGDWVAYIVNGTSHYGILTNVTFKMNAHNVLESAGESEQSNSYADVGVSATAKHYTQVADKKLEKRIELEADRISLVASDVSILGQQIQLKVDSNGVVSAINLSEEGVRIDASKLNINGVISANGNFEVDTSGNLTASNATISGAITATSLTLGNGVSVAASNVSGLATVATTGSYNSLSNKPDLTVYVQQDVTIGSTPSVSTTGFKVSSAGLLTASNAVIYGSIYATSLTLGSNVTIGASKVSGLSTVATSGSYSDLSSKPDLTVYVQKDGTIGSTPASGVTGFKVSSAGLLTASNAVIYGTIYATNGTFAGTITSSSGTIGGWSLSSSNFYGAGSTTYTFTTADYQKIQNIISGSYTPTDAEREKYDVNGDGVISVEDYIIVKLIVDEKGGTWTQNATVTMGSTDANQVIKIQSETVRGATRETIIGANYVKAHSIKTTGISGETLSLTNWLTVSGKVTFYGSDYNGSSTQIPLTLDNVASLKYTVVSTF